MSDCPGSRPLLLPAEQLMDGEAIDDEEFAIPQVDTPPTLESILNEPEDEVESFILEDTIILNAEDSDVHVCETSSLGSSDSGDCAHFNRTGRRKTTTTEASTHGSIVRHSLLKGISAQIVSAADKVDAGLPTAITVSSVVAVGTSHGLVLVFGKDHNQALQLCLGSTGSGSEYGAVSALSVNHDCTRLLCGFANGQITMWDLANGKLLRTITDAHPPGAAILHVKFMDNPTVAVCNDSGGSVFELSFRRIMGIRTCESRCLFSGSKGEVCCIEPLHTGAEMKDHSVTQYSLLAMASLTKVLLVGLKPSLKVWMTFPYGKTDPASVPLLAWQFVVVQKAINPVLAFCRGSVIYFLLIKRDELGTMHVIKQQELHLSCDIISLSWVNSHTLVLMDSLERLRVVDRPSQEELEVLDMSECQLVYNSSHFKSLATGGNVSQALALVGERACYQSICCYGGEVVYLGTKSVHIIILRKWWERVDHLLKQEKFKEALSLAWSFSEGTAKAVLGLFADSNKTKAVVSSKMVEILLQYVEFCLNKCPEQGKIIMEQQFQDRIPVIVEYCLLLQRIDLLCDQMYSRLAENPAAKGVFLKSLEPYILSERIGCLSVNVMRDLLSYFRENNMMESVERCLVHMDITNLDIQQVVQMCWDHQLYDAMIYVFNRGMNDYISPMEKLFQAIGPIQHKGSALTDEHIAVGNKLLVYISCCLAGRAYPLGDIPQDLVHQVKYQVFEFLVRVHSMEAVAEEEMFPFIRTLLCFDTQEFLNVLALTFEDFKNDKQAVEFQQRIVDILLKIMVNSSDFGQSQVGCLFTFLARQLAKPDNTLFINRKLFDQVLEFLCTPNDSSRHAERQQVLLELLQVVGVVQIDETHLLDLAEKAEFYQICEYLYGKRRLYDKIIDCFLKDSLRKEDVFSFLHNILSCSDYSSQEKSSVSDKTLQHFKDLVCINSAKTAELVTLHFADEVPFIIDSIQDDQLIFQFLKCLLDSRSMSPQGVVRVGPEVHELLVNLMCQFRPQDVSAFLKTSQDYRMEETIQITKERGVHEATAYLLEQKGDFLGAFEVMLQILKDRLRQLVLKRSEVQLPDPPSCEDSEKRVEFHRVEEVVHDVIGLCQRSSECLNQEQRETLWFSLLELVLSPEKTVKGASAKSTTEDLKVLTMRILNSMSSFIPPHAIVHRILQDPVYGKGKLSEIQSLILGMLESFSYEETLLQTTTSLLNSDLHWSLSQLRKVVSKGLNPRQDHCSVCLQLYRKCHEREEDVFLFSCGHLYHCHCLEQKDQEVFSKRMLSRSCHKCKCSPSSRGTEQGRSAQTKAASSKCEIMSRVHCRKSKQTCGDPSAEAPQARAWLQLCSLYRGPSRMSILSELSDGLERDGVFNPFTHGAGHVPRRENLQLKLSALPLLED